MARRSFRRLLLASMSSSLAIAPAAWAAPASNPEWVEAYALEVMTAPVTLENAKKYHWYQIAHSVRSERTRTSDIDIEPVQKRLRQYGDGLFDQLKRQLDEKEAAITMLEEAGPFPTHCRWIMPTKQGDIRTPLQDNLEAYCRTKLVPITYRRLLGEYVERLNVSLPHLRNLDVTYPAQLVGTDAMITAQNLYRDYGQALEVRLAAAQPQVVGEITQLYRDKPLGEGPLRTGAAQCRELLGPWFPQSDVVRDMAMNDPLGGGSNGDAAVLRFKQGVGNACKREANAWLLRQQPALTTAITAGIAASDNPHGPVLSVQARCDVVLGRWFTTFDGFDLGFTGPLRQGCASEAKGVIDRALEIRAKTVAASLQAAPRTLEGLERNGWFEPSQGDLDAVADPRDAGRDEIVRLMREKTLTLTNPLRDVAKVAAVSQVAKAYAEDGPTDAGLRSARNVCAPYLGTGSRSIPPGGGLVRSAIEAACRDEEKKITAKRVVAAVTASNVDGVLGKGMLAVVAPEGTTQSVDPRMLVVAAAANGFQVAFSQTRSLFLSRTYALRITPLGQDAPALGGVLVPEPRADGVEVWRVTELDRLPALDGPLATLSCIARGRVDGKDIAVLAAAAGIAAVVFDASQTAGTLLGAAFEGLTSASICQAARQSFIGGTP